MLFRSRSGRFLGTPCAYIREIFSRLGFLELDEIIHTGTHNIQNPVWRSGSFMGPSVSRGPVCGLIGRLPVAMLNGQMLKDGFAYLLTIPPNVKYVKKFRKAALFLRTGFRIRQRKFLSAQAVQAVIRRWHCPA